MTFRRVGPSACDPAGVTIEHSGTPDAMTLLVVCTANICRSPMGEVLLQRAADARGAAAVVGSAGVRGIVGAPASDGSVHQMKRRKIDLSGHIARQLDRRMLDEADLVLTMEAAHVVDIVSAVEDVDLRTAIFARTFTLKEFVARAGRVGPRGSTTLSDYLEAVGGGRVPRDVVGMRANDVADPIGRPDRFYRRCADELDLLVDDAADLLWGT